MEPTGRQDETYRIRGGVKMRTSRFSLLIFAASLAARLPAQQFSEWSTPVNVVAINSSADEQHPAISKDGLSLYFASARPGGCGGSDIWVAQRDSADSPWGAPFNLGCGINSTANDLGPNLSTDGHRLFFHSFRSGGCGGGDVYYSERNDHRDDTGWQAPVNLNRIGRAADAELECGAIGSTEFVNTPNTDAGPNHFQNDASGKTLLYFTRSDQPTMLGDFDIYTAELSDDGTWTNITR